MSAPATATVHPAGSNAAPRYRVHIQLLPPEEYEKFNQEQDFSMYYRPNEVHTGPPGLGQALGLEQPTEICYIGGIPPYGAVRSGPSREKWGWQAWPRWSRC